MFQIDPMSRTPVYEQLLEQVERFILTDILPPGSQVPSVRNVAVTHSINPRTILKAYTDLDNRGVIQPVPGKGYFVCADAKEKLLQKGREKLEDFKTLLLELELAGITKEEIISCVNAVYAHADDIQGGETND